MVEYRPVEVGVVESFLRRVSKEGTAILAGGPRIRTVIVRFSWRSTDSISLIDEEAWCKFHDLFYLLRLFS